MRVRILPSSLFVPGKILTPMRLEDERAALIARKAKLEAELANIPNKIREIDESIAALGAELQQYESRRKQ